MAVQSGHTHVHQNEIEVLLLQPIQRELPGFDRHSLVAQPPEVKFNHLLVYVVVLDDEDSPANPGRGITV